jgi:hypothetical protein
MALASVLLALFGVASAQVQDGSIAARGSSAQSQYDNPSPLRLAVPDPQYCTVTPLLGNPAVPSSQVAFLAPGDINGTTITITVRSSSNAPIAGAAVFVSFGFGIKTCTTAVHAATTDTSGVCTIALRGGGCLSGVWGACVITANGVEIRNLRNVRSPDNNSQTLSAPDGRVSVVDLAFFADEYRGVAPPGCHDYDNNLLCDLTDLTYFGDAFSRSLLCILNP